MREQRSGSQHRGGLMGGPGPHMMIGSGQKAKDTSSAVRRLWGYLKHQKMGLLSVFFFVIVTTGAGLLGPYLMGKAIDDYIIPGDISGLAWIALMMVGVYITTAFTTWLQIFIMAGVSQRTVRDIRNDLFTKLQSLSLRFFDQQTHGELMSRLTNDVENINMVLGNGVTQFISSIISLVGIATIMLLLNIRLAVVSLVTIPFMVLPPFKFGLL